MQGYRDEFNERHYEIMMLREHSGTKLMTFSKIGELYNISSTRASQLYLDAKLCQFRLYLKRIQICTGKSSREINELKNTLADKYKAPYRVAWLEQEYKDILDAYRDGEPESRYIIDENMPKPRKFTIRDNSTEFFRMDFKEQELFVLDERDKKGNSFEEIGIKMNMTERKVANLYRTAKMVQFRRYVKEISQKTGIPYEEINYKYLYNGTTLLPERIISLKTDYKDILMDKEKVSTYAKP